MKICYLCGEKIVGRVSWDHVPPKQFYASILRKSVNLNLLTLPTHKSCNISYGKDEEYFLHSLAPVAKHTKTGAEIWKDIKKVAQKKESCKLIRKVYHEFTNMPNHIYLPPGIVAKKFEFDRIERVIWKIIRGLYYVEFNEILPQHFDHGIEIYDQYNRPREEFHFVRDKKSLGLYPGVFDYKKVNTDEYVMWGLLFWNFIMVLGVHPKSN